MPISAKEDTQRDTSISCVRDCRILLNLDMGLFSSGGPIYRVSIGMTLHGDTEGVVED